MTGPLERLTREVAHNLGDGPGPHRRARQRAAVARLTRAPSTRAPASAWWLVPLAVAVLLALLVARRPATLAPPPTVTVAHQAVMVGQLLLAPEHEALVLEFSDRSRLELAAGGAARLTSLESARVELDLERGTVTLHVHPVPGRAWSVSAGPFTVELDDADGRATWDPDTRAFLVDLERGDAKVAHDTKQPSRVTAGQRLELRDEVTLAANTPTHEDPPVAITAPGPATSTPPSSSSAPAVRRSSANRPSTTDAPRAGGATAVGQLSWSARADAGDHAGALAAAERLGFSRLLRDLGVDDLDQLARCARLAGDGPRARQALEALRRRFPADARARTAAFLLGRVALDLERDGAAAGRWFSTYLSEAPDGPLAEDARRRIAELDRRE